MPNRLVRREDGAGTKTIMEEYRVPNSGEGQGMCWPSSVNEMPAHASILPVDVKRWNDLEFYFIPLLIAVICIIAAMILAVPPRASAAIIVLL